MKKILFILTVIGLFFTIGCSSSSEVTVKVKSHQDYCAEYAEHMIKIMLDSQEMKKMSEEKISQMKEEFIKDKQENIQKCVEDYDKETIDCFLESKNVSEANRCISKMTRRLFKKASDSM